MKIIVTVSNGPTPIVIEGMCQMGEYQGDGRFDQPLIGDELLASIMHAWVSVAPERRTFGIVGEDQHAHLTVGYIREHGDRKGVNILVVAVDDTTWLHALDQIKQELPYPSLDWEIELISAAPPVAAPHPKERPPFVPDPIRDDPSFWVDEHSDLL